MSQDDAKRRLDDLYRVVRDAGRILILPHVDPDPDAVASAVALRHLLTERVSAVCEIAFRGLIGRAENRALVRYLGNPLQQLANPALLSEWPVALVDTQPTAGNSGLPRDTHVTLVFDHHPWRETTQAADFFDVRPQVGSTSTILTQYLQAAKLEPGPLLATALFYGIKSDTLGLIRGASAEDVEAYFYLQPLTDVTSLLEIERAQVPFEYFDRLAEVLHAARVYRDVVVSFVGGMGHADLAAEMADLLLRLDGMRWAVCMGQYQSDLIIAVRTMDPAGGAGALVQSVVGDWGSAGGHGAMAGGQVHLLDREPQEVARELARRVLQYLGLPPDMAGESLLKDNAHGLL